MTKLFAEDGISRTTPRRQDTSAGRQMKGAMRAFRIEGTKTGSSGCRVVESALDREKTNSTWVATEIYLVERINIIRTF